MRSTSVAAWITVLSTSMVHALGFPGTCRGPTAEVIEISGLNSREAKMTAKHARPDAISYCVYDGASSDAEIETCASQFMKDRKGTTYEAQADCQEGILTIVVTGLPAEFPKPTYISNYKFPITSMCGGDNMQAIAVFQILCPSYEGKIEKDE